MKYFTIEQAEALIPELERIFDNVLEIHAKAEAKARRLSELEGGGAQPSELVLEKSQLQFLLNGVNEWLQRILDLGALPKGIDLPLVDFPYRLGGREVYLCWRLGEKRITHYHGLEEGFAGRKALPRAAHSTQETQ